MGIAFLPSIFCNDSAAKASVGTTRSSGVRYLIKVRVPSWRPVMMIEERRDVGRKHLARRNKGVLLERLGVRHFGLIRKAVSSARVVRTKPE
jgi:hypothetical protein